MAYALRGLGWLMDEYATLGLMDSESLTTKALCGNAKAVQQALRDQGFYNGSIDGILGSGSVAAIKAFSVSAGIGSKSWPDPAFCQALKTAQEKKLAAAYTAAHPPETVPTAPGDQGGSYTAPPDGGVVGVSQPGTVAPGGQSGSTTATGETGLSKKTMLLAGAGVLGVLGIGCLIYAASKETGGEGEMKANRRGSRRRSRRSSKRGSRRSARRSSGRRGRGRRGGSARRWKSYWAGVAKLAPAHRRAARTGRPVPVWAQY